MISGKTTLIAHIGYPTEAFKAPLIYNPWFDQRGIDAVVVPMGVQAEDYPASLKSSVPAHQHPRGAGDDAAQGDDGRRWSTNARRRSRSRGPATPSCKRPDGSLLGDMFDGDGLHARPAGARASTSPARAAWSSGPAASGRRSRHRLRRKGSRRSRCSTPTPRGGRARRAAAAALSEARRAGSAPTTRPATTWSSTARRSA